MTRETVASRFFWLVLGGAIGFFGATVIVLVTQAA